MAIAAMCAAVPYPLCLPKKYCGQTGDGREKEEGLSKRRIAVTHPLCRKKH